MDLLEYQTKELFRQIGIPVLPSQRIAQPTDVKELKIPYPIVLKSQVQMAGRNAAGGVRMAENTIDAIASAQAIFHLPIMGRYPELLLAEPKYKADWEFYLAIVLDSATRRPLLLGSQYGGAEITSKLEYIQQVIVDQEFSPFHARRLALKMGLKGEFIQSVSVVLEKMYRLFVQQDLDIVEINPLAVNASGELMVLDGKITVNSAALGRHDDLVTLLSTMQSVQSVSTAVAPSSAAPSPVALSAAFKSRRVEVDGNIGLLSHGSGLILATLDLLKQAKGKPYSFVDLGEESSFVLSSMGLQKRFEQGLNLIFQDKAVKVVLVNLLGSSLSCLEIAEVLLKYLSDRPNDIPALVLRLVGAQFHQARELLLPIGISVVEQLDEAVSHTATLARTQSAWRFELNNSRYRPQPSGGLSGWHSIVPRP